MIPYDAGFINKSDGSGGSLTFKDLRTNDVFTVVTDTSLDRAQLNQMRFAGVKDRLYGIAFWYTPRTNHVVAEVAKVKGNPNQGDYMLYPGAQIHETGNSIAMLLGDPLRRQQMENRPIAQDPKLRAFDIDSGMALQECVLGADLTKQQTGIK